ncbi:hypothetical protein Pres01_51730 [Metapseudomonas resinovorans]|nr:hypothetical protein Pres01_51730 [Pseudomonas resinovorans]
MSLSALTTSCLGPQDALVLARRRAPDWETWLQPIGEQSAVGEDPGYDDDFQRMRDEVNRLSGADAELVAQLAEKLLTQRCKDLRVATYYLWARLQPGNSIPSPDGRCRPRRTSFELGKPRPEDVVMSHRLCLDDWAARESGRRS